MKKLRALILFSLLLGFVLIQNPVSAQSATATPTVIQTATPTPTKASTGTVTPTKVSSLPVTGVVEYSGIFLAVSVGIIFLAFLF